MCRKSGRGPRFPKAAEARAPKWRRPRCPQSGGGPGIPKATDVPASAKLRRPRYPESGEDPCPKAAEALAPPVSPKRRRPIPESIGGPVLPKQWRPLTSATLGIPRPPPLWGRGLPRFRETGASTRFGDTSPAVLWGHWGPAPLWGHRALAALDVAQSTVGPKFPQISRGPHPKAAEAPQFPT